MYVVEWYAGEWASWQEIARFDDLKEAKKLAERYRQQNREARIVTERNGYVHTIVQY